MTIKKDKDENAGIFPEHDEDAEALDLLGKYDSEYDNRI